MYGIPWDVLSQWDEDEVLAAIIICGEHEGGQWDWDKMGWRPPPSS